MSYSKYDRAYCGGRFKIPQHMKEGLRLYVEEHCMPGHFLQAVISNNLSEAVGRADTDNLENLPAYIMFFYNEVDSRCWGSKEKMNAWVAMGENNDNPN